jgi:uncharacterized protein
MKEDIKIKPANHDSVTVDEAYSNQAYKTHKGGKVKNKYKNLPCPCGSGKKFKKCCINKVD